MRVLGIGEECDLAAMYDRLAAAGHEVRVYTRDEISRELIRKGIAVVTDWKNELGWIRDGGDQSVIVFESAERGQQQDELRGAGYRVFGGCAYGDRLEADRDFGQAQLREVGIKTAPIRHFTDYQSAIDFIQGHPGRYVFKNNGAGSVRSENLIGESADGRDVIGYLQTYQSAAAGRDTGDFVLMQHLEGVEVGVGAYFNGQRFLRTVCIDWEHKRFFPGEMGELTGEMGTIVSYRGAEPIFTATLARMAEKLREHRYIGYINLNLIANAEGLWPLEFTCRFGYPGYAICSALHLIGWAEIFDRVLQASEDEIPTSSGYAAGIVLTVPPFPHPYGYDTLSKGSRILFREDATSEDLDNIHLAEVAGDRDTLRAAGKTGCLGVATGIGDTILQAREKALRRAHAFVVPNLRYRTDIGDRLINGELEHLRQWGYWY